MLATLCTPKAIEAVAASVQMSKRHFLRVFKRATGTTPHSWRLGEKVRRTQRDLLKGPLSLNEIAHAYGFADHAHYSRAFKRVVGTSPSVWRNRAARDGEAAKVLAASTRQKLDADCVDRIKSVSAPGDPVRSTLSR
jgi:transcriptional regulator GlxA family with amidase domain